MNKMDLLLKIDTTKLVKPVKEVEITRLSEILKEPFTVTCQALTPDEFSNLQNSVSVSQDGNIDVDKNIQVQTVIAGVSDPQFTNQKVIEHFKAVNSTEAVNNLLLPGEIQGIYTEITKLSGFGKDAVKEVKNLSK